MKDYKQLHDDALDYERDIEFGMEMLVEKRLKMYREKDADVLKEVVPALNAIIHSAERYKAWIKECDACLNQYLCGKYGDEVGCRCQDANEECTFVPDDIRQFN